jgi:hypothetical protein
MLPRSGIGSTMVRDLMVYTEAKHRAKATCASERAMAASCAALRGSNDRNATVAEPMMLSCPCIRPVFSGGIRLAFLHVIERSDAPSGKDRFPLDLIDSAFLASAGFRLSFGFSASPCHFQTFSIRKSFAVCERESR